MSRTCTLRCCLARRVASLLAVALRACTPWPSSEVLQWVLQLSEILFFSPGIEIVSFHFRLVSKSCRFMGAEIPLIPPEIPFYV